MARGDGCDELVGALIITAPMIARRFDWPLPRAKRWLRAHGILHKQRGKYGRVYTTFGELRSEFPKDVDDIVVGMPELRLG